MFIFCFFFNVDDNLLLKLSYLDLFLLIRVVELTGLSLYTGARTFSPPRADSSRVLSPTRAKSFLSVKGDPSLKDLSPCRIANPA